MTKKIENHESTECKKILRFSTSPCLENSCGQNNMLGTEIYELDNIKQVVNDIFVELKFNYNFLLESTGILSIRLNKKKLYKFIIFIILFLTISLDIKAQNLSPENQNDSITLAQAYINLSLTEKYFETISPQRISKIIPFEESELASIVNQSFIDKNFKLYNFAYSLLYFNRAKFLFSSKTEINREVLMEWKKTLDKAITHFYLSDNKGYYSNDVFYDLINFTEESRNKLHYDIFKLKRKFGAYFNNDIHPDFKRIFNVAKSSGQYSIDSLSYYAKKYDLDINTAILNHEYNADNYNFGPKTSALNSIYHHVERNYAYRTNYPLQDDPYFLDPQLDLISRYLQLKFMASVSYNQSLKWFDLYKLYNAYNIFHEDLRYYFFSEDFRFKENAFFKNELNMKVSELLYEQLRNKFPYDSFILAQSYINLSIMDSNFDEITSDNISKILTEEKNALIDVKDAKFRIENSALYDFTYSLLYFNAAKLGFRDQREINRNELIQWKNSLEKAIKNFNLSQNISHKDVNMERDEFYKLIKFTEYSQSQLRWNINNLKKEFTPFFNKDIYTEFKRLFYVAKNTGNYQFEALLSSASIYNLSLKMAILNINGDEKEEFPYSFIELEYLLDEKLDLIARYLQLKYLASEKDTKLPDGLSLYNLYSEYNRLKWEVVDINDVFFEIELNSEVLEILYKELKIKFPFADIIVDYDSLAGIEEVASVYPVSESIESVVENSSYFFPNPAPLASANLTVSNYKPSLNTLEDVDNHMSGILNSVGYGEHLHYYYHALNGFALTTSLEKFNTDGSKVENNERWVKNLGSNAKFSYYETFKSLFFDIESEFRMFAFIVASENVSISSRALSAGFAEELIRNSYDSLPEDLKNKTLVNKNLSVLVYHFHQNDIGEVPMLDISGNISALEHLKMAGLSTIVE